MSLDVVSTLTAYLPAEAVRGRNSRQILEIVHFAALAVSGAPLPANDGASRHGHDAACHGRDSVVYEQ